MMTGFHPICSCIYPKIRMDNMDANRMHREKARRERHKNDEHS